MRVDSVGQIWRYPVKSMGGEGFAACRLEEVYGVPGDRAWRVRDDQVGASGNRVGRSPRRPSSLWAADAVRAGPSLKRFAAAGWSAPVIAFFIGGRD